MFLPACLRLAKVSSLLVCGLVAFVVQADEPTYPNRPVRWVLGMAAGGGGDALARIIAPKLRDAMGQAWIIDNRGGAGGNVAAEIVARANPDGYTALMVLDTTLTVNPTLYRLPFSVEKDLQPIAILSVAEQVLVVHPSVQATTFKEFIALAKQKPGVFNYGSSGIGSNNHLGTELLKKRAGIDLVHVPYQGGGPAVAAMLTGETQVLASSIASTIAYISNGRLRALAVTGAKRSKVLPELPTVAESGYPGFEASSVNVLLVPGATPKRIAEHIRNETLKALQQADVQATLARLGQELAEPSTSVELAARFKRETAVWASVIKDAGIRAE